MYPYGITLENLDSVRLYELVEDQVPEGRSLDYKQTLALNGSEDKKEFLADISSFANADGGVIIYGISEQQDDKGKNNGLPRKILGLQEANLDEVSLRIENIIRDGISPRIIGISIKRIDLTDGNQSLVIFIPKSWNKPHAVTFAGSMRFYSRNAAGKYPLDTSEVRSAFLNQNNIEKKLRRFSLERTTSILTDSIPTPLEEGPKVIAHIQPFDKYQCINLPDLKYDYSSLKLLYGSQISTCRFNLDGLFFCNPVKDGKTSSYTQVFRNGIIEGATSFLIRRGQSSIPYITVEDKIIYFFDHYRSVLKKYGIDLPYLISLRLFGIKGLKILDGNYSCDEQENYTFDRNDLPLPEVIVDTHEIEMEILLRPVFDALWQSANWPGSTSYNDQGLWIRSKRESRS